MNFKIGDRVKAIRDIDGDFPTTGEEGVIAETYDYDYDVLFDKDVDGWGDGNRTLCCGENDIELISSEAK